MSLEIDMLKEWKHIWEINADGHTRLICFLYSNLRASLPHWIKHFRVGSSFSVNFNKEFNSKLLPHTKLTKKIPTTINKDIFIKIFNEEQNLKHKCWLLLAYCSGLRVEEIAGLKIENINSKEHQLKVLCKRKKEKITFKFRFFEKINLIFCTNW